MGEVVVSSEDVNETEKENGVLEGNLETTTTMKNKGGSSASGAELNLARFLPMPALRVLLVEADDSTRQIICALLRKCTYRVAAVPDGLKAWEMLKGRPHNVDLILTEVDLPSISGFALLTLIMEHDVCKNIPVIMMSSQDSVSTVYKCMLRGAADYLVKPIRRNELRNLWQHVWRRRSLIGGNSPRDESVGQKQVEASSENGAASIHSIGCLAGVQKNKEQTEKGSDAQSSCTKPDTEAESTHKENMQEFSHLIKAKSLPKGLQEQEAHASFNQNMLMHQTQTEVSDAYTPIVHEGVELENQRRDTNILVEAGDTLVDSAREAIDFMGKFNKNCNSSSINSTIKLDSSLYLDLSLRNNPSVFENHFTQERPTLWHPNSSAFTRYTSGLSQPLQSTLMSVGDRNKDSETNSEKILTNIISEYNSRIPSPTLTSQRSMIPSTTGATGELKQTEVAAPCTQHKVFPVPVPVKGIRLNNPCNGYNSIVTPIFCARSCSSMPSPSSANQQEPGFHMNLFRHSSFETNSGQLYDRLASNTNQSPNQPLQKLDSIEDRGHISPTTDQSASSNICNGSLSQLNCVAYGSTGASNGNVDLFAISRASTESKNDESFPSPSGNSCRSIQREAALMKFRLKRKDRCFEKKVRYESRKKLAEQRPRVKGQFVRQVQADPMHTEAEHSPSGYA